MSTSNDNYIEIFGRRTYGHERNHVTAKTSFAMILIYHILYRFSDVTSEKALTTTFLLNCGKKLGNGINLVDYVHFARSIIYMMSLIISRSVNFRSKNLFSVIYNIKRQACPNEDKKTHHMKGIM